MAQICASGMLSQESGHARTLTWVWLLCSLMSPYNPDNANLVCIPGTLPLVGRFMATANGLQDCKIRA